MTKLFDPENTEARKRLRQAANKQIKKLERQKTKIINDLIELAMLQLILDEADGKTGQSTITISV